MTLEDLLVKSKKWPPVEVTRKNTVLLLIDMQKLALSDHILHEAVKRGVNEAEAKEALRDYDERFNASNKQAAKLLEAFREKDMTPIHVKIEAYSSDARDTGRAHRLSNYLVPPGDEWGEWVPEVAPLPGEIVLTKTCSGAVTGTMLDKVLTNMDILNVFTVGYYLDQCVETTVRDLADLGYLNFLVSDAVMTATMKRYQNTMENIVGVYTRAITTDEAIELIKPL